MAIFLLFVEGAPPAQGMSLFEKSSAKALLNTRHGEGDVKFFCLLFFERSYLLAEGAEEAENPILRHCYGESGVKFFCLLFFERSYLFAEGAEEAENPILRHNFGESDAKFFCLLFLQEK